MELRIADKCLKRRISMPTRKSTPQDIDSKSQSLALLVRTPKPLPLPPIHPHIILPTLHSKFLDSHKAPGPQHYVNLPIARLDPYVDTFNLMAFDYAGPGFSNCKSPPSYFPPIH